MAQIWHLKPLGNEEDNNEVQTLENIIEHWQVNATKNIGQQYSADTKHH